MSRTAALQLCCGDTNPLIVAPIEGDPSHDARGVAPERAGSPDE